jgi:hypothetical protein
MEDSINYMEIDRAKQLYATDAKANMDYFDWRDLGISKGWISEPFCDTHDAGYMTEEEEKEWEEGNDPCMFVFRIWEENIEKKEEQLESLFDELL